MRGGGVRAGASPGRPYETGCKPLPRGKNGGMRGRAWTRPSRRSRRDSGEELRGKGWECKAARNDLLACAHDAQRDKGNAGSLKAGDCGRVETSGGDIVIRLGLVYNTRRVLRSLHLTRKSW